MLRGLVVCLWMPWVMAMPPREVNLTSLEWPPYTGKSLLEQGKSSLSVREALRRSGLNLSLHFMPWSKAIELGLQSRHYDGYFPEYDSPAIRTRCYLSAPFGFSPLQLASRSDSPVRWKHETDLSRYRLGIVRDYVNTITLDNRIQSGKQPALVADDDQSNLMHLLDGQVEASVIDAEVFEYLRNHDRDLLPRRDELQLQSPPLEIKTLHICFQRTERGKRLMDRFNRAIQRKSIELDNGL